MVRFHRWTGELHLMFATGLLYVEALWTSFSMEGCGGSGLWEMHKQEVRTAGLGEGRYCEEEPEMFTSLFLQDSSL